MEPMIVARSVVKAILNECELIEENIIQMHTCIVNCICTYFQNQEGKLR